MKRTILVVLMVALVTTPCLAQEVETDGIFSIEGTLWRVCGIGISDEQLLNIGCYEMGFDQGTVYSNKDKAWSAESLSYIDTPLVSIAYIGQSFLQDLYLFIMQPSGFGVYTRLYSLVLGGGFETGIMFKVGTPEPQFVSIAPSEGEQGDQNIMAIITAINTHFTSGETFVSFGEGIEVVGAVDVDSRTELSVQINIDETATPGPRSVTVTYPGGVITGVNVFYVLESTF
jgi:hypothetical protein